MPSTSDHNATASKKEVIRFKAKKYDGHARPEAKTFSVDPDLTTFATLRELLIKAFDIKGDFVISYLVRGHKGAEDRYLPMLSEWDLNTAIYGASDPHVVLKVDLKPFEASGLDEWDIIDEDDVARVAASSTSIFGSAIPSVRQIFSTASSTSADNESKRSHGRSWFFGRGGGDSISFQNSASRVSKANGGTKKSTALKGPMTDAEFRSYLDAEGRLLHPNSFRVAVYKAGLEPSLRPVVWRHLLNIYQDGTTGEERIAYTKRLADKYYCLKESWQRRLRQGFIGEELRLVANAVRKDVIRTDRTHPFFAGDEDRNKNLMALFNLLTTYALAHPEVSYCQGMSDLASPLLVVMKDEAQAYICFCALMRRLRQNFSCDGWAMTRKFQHLSELLQYYDPTFYEYLREMHADDLLFAYRWLLLELKREFSFDDALNLMEVMWASLPSTPPPRGCDLDLYDVDLTAYDDALASLHSMSSWSSPAGSGSTLLSPLQLPQLSMEDGGLEVDANGDFDSMDGNETESVGDGGVNISIAKPCRQASITSTHSCPGHMGCMAGVCPALVVRSLMLNHKENSRLHALRHASYPPKFHASDENQLSARDADLFLRFSMGRWTDELHNDILELGEASMIAPAMTTVETIQPLLPPPPPQQQQQQQALELSGRNGATNPFDSNIQMVRRNSDAACVRSYAVRPSTETTVKDKEKEKNELPAAEISPRQVLPALIATEAGSESDLNSDKDSLGKRDLTLTDIQEICMSHIPLEDSSPVAWQDSAASKASPDGVARSRESSGNQLPQNSNAPSATLVPAATAPLLTSMASGQVAKSRHASSSAASYIVTNLDSGYSDGNTILTRSLDFASRASTTASTDPQNLADVADFISVDRDPRVLLPPPHEFGDGNPFMLFVCLTLLLQHRDHIMKNQMDFNEIAIYFDKLMRKHNAGKVLKRARVLFADYLRTGWFDNTSTITKSDSVSAPSAVVSKYVGENGSRMNGQKASYWSLF